MNLEKLTSSLLGAALALLAPEASAQVPAPAPVAAGGVSAQAGKLTSPPRVTKWVPAELPPDAKVSGTPPSVLLDVAVGEDGLVKEVSVAESAGEPWDDAAKQAVLQFVFAAAEIDGKLAGVKLQYRYDFAKVAAPVEVPKTSRFEGVVRDRKRGVPLVGVTVRLDDLRQVVTDEAGHFLFEDVSPGSHGVMLEGAGFTPVGTEETIEASIRYQASYDVDVGEADADAGELADFELVVTAPSLQKKIAATEVTAEQGAKVAGTGGDVVKVVENLPGVARSSSGSGTLVVWGSGARDTNVYVNGVHIPVLYHEGGFRSVVHSDLVSSVELEPGGYGVGHGRGLGGLVTVGLRPMDDSAVHGSAAVDVIDAAASIRGGLGSKWRYAAAARKSHLDWMLERVTNNQVADTISIPRYWDAQGRLAYLPSEGESVEVGTLLSSDHVRRAQPSVDPLDVRSETRDVRFSRVYLHYRREMAAAGTAELSPWMGYDYAAVKQLAAGVPAQQTVSSQLWGFRGQWSGNVMPHLTVDTGLDFEATRSDVTRLGSITTPPREGDVRVFGQTPANQVNADDWSTVSINLAPYIQGDLALADERLHIVPGLRFEPVINQTSRIVPGDGQTPAVGVQRLSAPLEPRLAVRWQVTERLSAKAATGIYHQSPLAEEQSAVFGNPQLGRATATHYLVGGGYRLTDVLSLESTGFYSKMTGLVMRNPEPAPAVGQLLVDSGAGRAMGVQMMLRCDPVHRFFGWVSGSLIRSQRLDLATGKYRPFDYDQTWVLTAVGSYDLGRGFEFGARARWSTGYPRTPVLAAVYDSKTDSYQPSFGATNSSRLPDFYQFDARFSKRFKLGESSDLELYLDVQNVTNHANPEEVVYNYDYTQKSYITGLPLLPVIGGKLTW
jgi:hypothetical protein